MPVNLILAGAGAGVLLAILDGLINANDLAQRLFEVYKPIARSTVNAAAGSAIDLVFGIAMAGLFWALYGSLPGQSGWAKGLSFGLLAWFFRVLMSVASQWIMFQIPPAALAYILTTGLGEMLLIGVFLGAALRPAS